MGLSPHHRLGTTSQYHSNSQRWWISIRRIEWYKKSFCGRPCFITKKGTKRCSLFCDRGLASITSETITSPRYPIIIDLLRPTSAPVVSRNGGHTFRSFGRLQARRLAVLTISCSSGTPLGGRRYHWRPSKVFGIDTDTWEGGGTRTQKERKKAKLCDSLFYINNALSLSPHHTAEENKQSCADATEGSTGKRERANKKC